ncbi:hypothetical protein P3W45_000390 [Vairimorpha bombi]|jgi:hypothetical protein
MISEQIKKLKKSSTVKLQYSNSEDLETESLLDMIPEEVPRTKYLSTSSLHFDRQRLTKSEEIKFNKKFRPWMRSLIEYHNTEGYEYLLDFLVRKYHVQKFNQHDLLFITLPFPKYYNNNLTIFEYLQYQKGYSTEYIAECCAKYVDFFHFFIEYFGYYDCLKEFLDEIVEFFIIKNINFMHKYINEINEIIEKLKNNELGMKLQDALDGKCFISKNTNDNAKILKNINYNEECYKNRQGRALLKNKIRLEEYILWLDKSNLNDESFTNSEYDLLKMAFGISKDIVLEDDFENYKNLLEEMTSREIIVKMLYDRFMSDIIKIDQNIYSIYDKDTILKVISAKNYKQVEYKDFDILLKCMDFVNFDPDFFGDVEVSFDKLNELVVQNKSKKIFLRNYVQLCASRNIQNEFTEDDKNEYITLGEDNIENCRDYDIVKYNYEKDKNVVHKITNYVILSKLCDEYGYKEILNNFDLEFISEFAKHIIVDVTFLEYLIDRFDLEKLLDILKVHYCKLVYFNNHKSFNKMKIILKEFANDEHACKFIFDTMFNKLYGFIDHLDLVYIYQSEYNFINNYKDGLLEICDRDIDLMDYLITNTDYEDIRIVNKISTQLISRNKPSILTLFNKYGNIMKLYIKEFIERFNYQDYSKDLSLMKVNSNELIKYVIEFKKIPHYEYLIIQILKNKKDIKLEMFCDVEDLSDTLMYCILKYKFINEVDFDVSKLLASLFVINTSLFMKLTKFYTEDIKNHYFNLLIKDRKYERINKHFSNIKLENQNIVHDYIKDYYNGEDIETEISYLSNNIKDIKKLVKDILKSMTKDIPRTLRLLNKLMDNHKEIKLCHKLIYENILLLLDSRDNEIRNLSRDIYSKIPK